MKLQLGCSMVVSFCFYSSFYICKLVILTLFISRTMSYVERPVSPGVKKEEQDVKTTIADRSKPTAAAVIPRCTAAAVPRYPVSLLLLILLALLLHCGALFRRGLTQLR